MSVPSRNSQCAEINSGRRTFFVTASSYGKKPLFLKESAAKLFVRTMFEYRNAKHYLLHEFVLMPDHFHVLLTVGAYISIEKVVQLIKGGFSFRAARMDVLRGEVWQRGFSEVRVVEEDQYAAFSQYIHENPVRRRLVPSGNEYLFCSAYPGYRLDPKPQGLKPRRERAVSGTTKVVP